MIQLRNLVTNLIINGSVLLINYKSIIQSEFLKMQSDFKILIMVLIQPEFIYYQALLQDIFFQFSCSHLHLLFVQLAQAIVQEMKQYLWIDRQTRAVILEFTVYCPNVNRFVYVTLLAEFPETGGVVPFVKYEYDIYFALTVSNQILIFYYLIVF